MIEKRFVVVCCCDAEKKLNAQYSADTNDIHSLVSIVPIKEVQVGLSFEPRLRMKTAVLLVLFGLAVELSYALLISEDKTQPSEDEDRLKRNSFLHTGTLRYACVL